MFDIEYLSGGDPYETIVERCAQATASATSLGLTNQPRYYCETINAFLALSNCAIVPVAELAQENKSNKLMLALRHDVDANMVSAITCAKYLNELNIPGTFFILHTSHYYGVFSQIHEKPCFTRHSGFEQMFQELIETNREIGIHNDALGLCFDHNAKGTDAFTGELKWMKNFGADIKGSAAHNSPAVYGAECFEIFRGLAVGDRRTLHWRGKSIPLQSVSMHDLGLTYEANHPVLRPSLDAGAMNKLSCGSGDLLRQKEWQRQYFLTHPVFERGYDYDAWLIGNDAWLLAGGNKVRYPLTLGKLIEEIKMLPLTSRIMISIHPVYVGQTPGTNSRKSMF